ncbi:MAG: GNAT family N-acetyltransferase [Agathobacter sp.]|nr:GNAT family N-acetyltransferase [Agathobacter sp.]
MNKDLLHVEKSFLNGNKLYISHPLPSQLPELRQLWKETFGDSDEFLDTFQATAFSLNRCRCVVINDMVVAALYWFNCEFQGSPIAYIYAVATAREYRGQGICHALMKNTHIHLKELGYTGAILSPASKSLFDFYEKMGYKTCAYNDELIFKENSLYSFEKNDITIRKIDKNEFAKLRQGFLPKDAVLQENENLDFLETQAEFFAGKNFLLTAKKNDFHLQGIEFLGDTSIIPAILQVLHCTSGNFRTVGKSNPFGMYYSFTDITKSPSYIGFVFD